MSYVCKTMSVTDVNRIEENAKAAISSNAAALMHSVEFLRTTPQTRWVTNEEKNNYLHSSYQLPESGRYFHFYANGLDIRLEVFDGIYQSQTPVKILSAPKLVRSDILNEIRQALIVYYGPDEMFAVNPVFEEI